MSADIASLLGRAKPEAERRTAVDHALALLEILFAHLVSGTTDIGRALEGLLNAMDQNPDDPAWKFFPAIQQMMVGVALTQLQRLKEKLRAQARQTVTQKVATEKER